MTRIAMKLAEVVPVVLTRSRTSAQDSRSLIRVVSSERPERDEQQVKTFGPRSFQADVFPNASSVVESSKPNTMSTAERPVRSRARETSA